MPKLHSETFGGGDQTWLASDHGIYNARTFTIDSKAFAAVQAEKGFVPSGYPLAQSGDKLVPYTGTGDFAGHLYTDQDARHGDIAVPVFYHGAVHASRVPAAGFTAPAAQKLTDIVYL